MTTWRYIPKIQVALILTEAISLVPPCIQAVGHSRATFDASSRWSRIVSLRQQLDVKIWFYCIIKVEWLSFEDLSTYRHFRSFRNCAWRRPCEVITENEITRSSTATKSLDGWLWRRRLSAHAHSEAFLEILQALKEIGREMAAHDQHEPENFRLLLIHDSFGLEIRSGHIHVGYV